MKYIIRHTKDVEFETIEQAREYRDQQPSQDNLLLIVKHYNDDEDPFGDRWDKHPNAAKPKNK